MTDRRPIRPAHDSELESSLLASGGAWVLDFDPVTLDGIRAAIRSRDEESKAALKAQGLVVVDLHARASDGYEIPLHHVYATTSSGPRACIFYVHGGGMVLGTPWDSSADFIRWITDFGVSVVTVDYRLAPAVRAPVPVEDCYAALAYVYERAAELGIDPEAIVVAGLSAGGGLAAGTALLARDRGGPPLRGQLLIAPMLDPAGDGESMRQLPHGPWNSEENAAAWALVLEGVPADAARYNTPGRVEGLADLAPAYLEVGSAEIFRSEAIDYANRIWRVGGDAELHVWSGGFHGFQAYPHAAVAQAAIEARRSWLARVLGYGPQEVARDARPSRAVGAER
jgi:acetyl esterase/lipase